VGEGNNHYWMLWRAFQDQPVSNLPDGIPVPFMDVVNLPLSLPTVLVDPALGFNQVVALNLLLAFAGAWALARELGISQRAALTAGVAALASPFLSGQVDFGLTESLPVGWIGLHAAALLRFGRTGEWRWSFAAGGALGAFVLAGWYHATFGLVVELAVVPVVLLRSRLPWWKRLAGVLGQGALAAVLVVPALLRFLEVKAMWAERWHPPSAFPADIRMRWRVTPNYGADLLNLVLPEVRERLDISQTVYVGLIGLTLAGLAEKRARWVWLVCAPLWLLALGHWLGVAGHTKFVGRYWRMPAGYLVTWFEPLQGLSHWHRAAGPATLFMAVGAASGVERISRRLSWVWIAAPVLILVDSIGLSQTRWPRQQVDTTVPEVLVELPEGGLLQLPFDNGRGDFSDDIPRRFNLWQPGHGHPVSENYEGKDALLFDSRVAAAADGLCGVPATVPHGWTPGNTRRDPDKALLVAEQEHALLRDAGIRYVVLHTRNCPGQARTSEFLTRALGPMEREQDEIRVWEIPQE
jgi:hypothetical protein